MAMKTSILKESCHFSTHMRVLSLGNISGSNKLSIKYTFYLECKHLSFCWLNLLATYWRTWYNPPLSSSALTPPPPLLEYSNVCQCDLQMKWYMFSRNALFLEIIYTSIKNNSRQAQWMHILHTQASKEKNMPSKPAVKIAKRFSFKVRAQPPWPAPSSYHTPYLHFYSSVPFYKDPIPRSIQLTTPPTLLPPE